MQSLAKRVLALTENDKEEEKKPVSKPNTGDTELNAILKDGSE